VTCVKPAATGDDLEIDRREAQPDRLGGVKARTIGVGVNRSVQEGSYRYNQRIPSWGPASMARSALAIRKVGAEKHGARKAVRSCAWTL
jgi:hypothetical protein